MRWVRIKYELSKQAKQMVLKSIKRNFIPKDIKLALLM
jgi:hypothetical protein